MGDRVEQTWEELGYKVRPTRFRVFVRTEPVYVRTEGGLFLPTEKASLYGDRMAHQVLVRAVVCSVGSVARDHWKLYPGQRIVFKRLHFAWLNRLEDGSYFGYLNASDVVGEPEELDSDTEEWLLGGLSREEKQLAAEYAMVV